MKEHDVETYWTPSHARLARALTPALLGTDWWDARHRVAWYVNLCEMAGFCDTDDMRRLCAERFMAGKKKVTPPGTGRKKRADKMRRRIARNMPQALLAAIEEAVLLPAAAQYAAGKERAMDSLVGFVMRSHKTDPVLVRDMLVKRLSDRSGS